ncbi:DMT family transporter [Kurthia sp. Dielmo]|uniref:DMT family transporter n=1 Tax=Kurthia sp. Dielmo TaxID=1033738 RepID=UPI0035120382
MEQSNRQHFSVNHFATNEKRIHFTFIFRHAGILLLSAIALSGNWIFLYQSYDYTSISNATLAYYFAPVFVLLLAPFLLKEAWTVKKVLCIIIALFGMILIVGASFNSIMDEQLGLLYGFAAAAFYATLMLVNKFTTEIDKLELTVIQLTLAAIVLGIYVSLTDGFHIAMLSYVDPLVAIVIFVWLLHEPMTIAQLMGAVLLLGSTLISELKFKKRI